MKIKTGKKTLRIYAYSDDGKNVRYIKIDGATNQNFENAIKAFLATLDCNELEIIGGQVDLEFSFKIEK